MTAPLYDSHAHFTDDAVELQQVLSNALKSNVTRILAVGGDDAANKGALAFRAMAKDNVRAALGFEMETASNANELLVEKLRKLVIEEKPQAIGEIGLDFHYCNDEKTKKLQIELFRAQLTLAAELALPVSVHTRNADEETLTSLDAVSCGSVRLRGSIHCFTGSVEFGKKLLDRGFCLGISGIVTFNKGENVRDIARMCPEDRLLIETDAPFLAPVPYRGRRCESAFVVETAKTVAGVRNCKYEEIAAIAFRNAAILFG